MWGIRRNLDKKRFSFVLHFLYPSHSGSEKQIGTVTLGLNEEAIMPDSRVKVFVSRDISTGAIKFLSNSTRSIDKGFVKTALVWLVGLLIT